jgi:hypothetical protein
MFTILILCLLSNLASAQTPVDVNKDPDFQQNLVSREASGWARKNGENYNTRNYINPYLHNIFMANNRAETGELRLSLNSISKSSSGRIRFVDLLGSKPVDWKKMTVETFESVQRFHSIAAVSSENLENTDAPVMVIFSSASHNLLATVTLDLMPFLTEKGFIVVMMEYPGYGGSLGEPGKENWTKASVGLLEFLHQKLGRKAFLLGHSIGSAVALEAASLRPDLVQGVISHAGFFSIKEASKDSTDLPSWLNNSVVPSLTRWLAKEHLWDNSKTLPLLGKHQVPAFFIHGSQDHSVHPRHLQLFRKEAGEVKKRNPQFPVFSESFPSASHEDLMINENYGPFNLMWESVLRFVDSAR